MASTWRWADLWRSHPSLQDSASQQRARLAAGLLIGLMPLGLITLFLPNASATGFWTGQGLLLGLLLAMATSYLLVRSAHVTAGVVLTLVAIEATVWVSRIVAADHASGQFVLAYLVVPIFLAGILLPARVAATFAALTFAAAIALESVVDQRLGTILDQEDLSFGVLLTAVAILALISSTMSQRQARQLDDSVKLLAQIAENIPEVFFIVAADFSKMLYTSPAYERVLGRTVAQAMADPQDWLKAVHPDDLARVREGLASGAPMLEFHALLPSGAIKNIRARTFPVHDAKGKAVSLVGVAEDVTEARSAQDARGADAAHPLAAAVGA